MPKTINIIGGGIAGDTAAAGHAPEWSRRPGFAGLLALLAARGSGTRALPMGAPRPAAAVGGSHDRVPAPWEARRLRPEGGVTRRRGLPEAEPRALEGRDAAPENEGR